MPVKGSDRHIPAPTPGRSVALSSRHKRLLPDLSLSARSPQMFLHSSLLQGNSTWTPVSQEGTGEGWKRWWLEESWAEGWLCHSGFQTSTLSHEPEKRGPRLPWSPEEIREWGLHAGGLENSLLPAGMAGLRRTPVRNGTPHPLQALPESFLQHKEVWRHRALCPHTSRAQERGTTTPSLHTRALASELRNGLS